MTEYTIQTNLRGRHDNGTLTGDDIDNAILSAHGECPLVGLGEVWVEVSKEKDINELYMAAHAALETGWGERSSIVREKNNLYGFRAFDDSPAESAEGYDSFTESIRGAMSYVDEEYLDPNGKYYNGANLEGMNVKYATAEDWAEGICGVMNTLADHLGSEDVRSDEWPVFTIEDSNEREAFYILQHLFEYHGYDLDYHDGLYGPEVESTITQFQRDNDLTVDGIAGSEVWTNLCITVDPDQSTSNWATYAVNHVLDRLLGYDVDPEDGDTDATKQAVSQFQRGMNLDDDGIVDLETWKAMVQATDD